MIQILFAIVDSRCTGAWPKLSRGFPSVFSACMGRDNRMSDLHDKATLLGLKSGHEIEHEQMAFICVSAAYRDCGQWSHLGAKVSIAVSQRVTEHFSICGGLESEQALVNRTNTSHHFCPHTTAYNYSSI